MPPPRPAREDENPRVQELQAEVSRLQSLIAAMTEATTSPLQHLASDIDSECDDMWSARSRVTTRSRMSTNRTMTMSTHNAFQPTLGDVEGPRGYATQTFQEQRHPGPRTRLSTITAATGRSDESEKDDEWRLGELLGEVSSSQEAITGNQREKIDDGAVVDNRESQDLPKKIALPFIMIGICLAIFLIALDRAIITTAIPTITSEFQSYDDIGWYGSAYLLTASAFQPLYGRVYQIFNIKWTYLAALAVFELGSLICGVAPNSTALIVGRAIAGLGSAGILTGSFVVVAHAVPLQSRPVYTAVVGMMFGVGSVTGPLLGGVFTDLVSWRWCFYFNLPVGGATVAAMLFLFNPKSSASSHTGLKRILQLDLIGNAILLGASIMLFLALEDTEEGYAWGSATVIGLLTGSGVTFLIFILWQWYQGEKALIPPRIINQRSVAASCVIAFFIYSALLIHSYYLPEYFQAIQNNSAVLSGVHMIPYMIANAVFSLIAGIVVSKLGYYTPPSIVGCAIATVGCGLLSTLGVNTRAANWIGYEILISAGFGLAIQQGFTAVQTVLPLSEVPIGTAAVVACQSFGGAVFVSVGNTILQNQLRSKGSGLPNVNIQQVIDVGASEFRSVVPASALPALLDVYDGALQKVFVAAVPLAGLAFVASLFLEWKSVKAKPKSDSKEGSSA